MLVHTTFLFSSNNLCLKVLRYKHNHIMSEHYGQNKTLCQVQQEYVWPEFWSFIKQFCDSCIKCKHSKAPHQKPYRLLWPLPVLEHLWNSISMDFIEQLPPSDGFTAVLFIVDQLSKQGVLILTHGMITSQGIAKLFIMHVFSKHSLSSHVTSDWGSEFVSHFFRSLGTALDTKLHFTSVYHPVLWLDP